MFRVKKIKSELEQAKVERDSLREILSETEQLEYYEFKQVLEGLTRRKEELEKEVDGMDVLLTMRRQDIDREMAEIERQVAEKRRDLVLMDDEILLQSFGFYRPKYELANSDAYKIRLDQIRDAQATMVKNGESASFPTNWRLNNNLKEGERMIKDYVKLIVRSFNNECDTSIVSVKFSNVDSIEKRIRKAYDILNQLGNRIGINIIPEYLNLKLQELYLCYEYQVKKQEEKEIQKRIREQMREEAKFLREIEEAKLRLGKEEQHFIKALDSITARIPKAASESERTLLEKEQSSIQQRIAEVEKSKLDILNRERNTRAGYVYIISNIGAFGENFYKIGMTRRLDPQERVDELGDASVPFNFDVHALIFSDDAPALEYALHKAFEQRRVNRINVRREFFRVTLEEIEHVIRHNFSKPVEFVELADAPEFRQSMLLQNNQKI